MKARASRFYGWTPSTIDNMPIKTFYEYLRAIDVLSSEEQLMKIEVEFAPHLKKEQRKDLVRKYKTKIRSLVDRTAGKLGSVQDVAKAFARMRMNG